MKHLCNLFLVFYPKLLYTEITVSRVLSGHPSIKPETRKLVLQCVKKLNYQPNTAARNLAGGKTNLTGVILPEISNPFFAEILPPALN